MAVSPPVRHRQLLWVVAAIAAIGAGAFSVPSDWLVNAENHATDLRVQARGAIRGEPSSVIVGIAESTSRHWLKLGLGQGTDADAFADQVARLAWSGLRGITP